VTPGRLGILPQPHGVRTPAGLAIAVAGGLVGALISMLFGALGGLLMSCYVWGLFHNLWMVLGFVLCGGLGNAPEGWKTGASAAVRSVEAVRACLGWARSGRHHAIPEMAARVLATVAVVAGGRGRAWRAEEFLADLTYPGGPRSSWAMIGHAGGLVGASARMRSRDLCGHLLRLLDWGLARPRAEALSAIAATAAAAYFLSAGGPSAFLVNLQNVGAAGGLLYAPCLWLRNYRNVPPARPHHDEPASRTRQDPES
jgi:hypothetical protein